MLSATRMTNCEGCEPGWCGRHQINKTPKLAELCRDESRPGYWEAWEGGYGPGQRAEGLGDRVAKAITTLTGGKIMPCGGCKQRQSTLNEFGQSIGIAPEHSKKTRP